MKSTRVEGERRCTALATVVRSRREVIMSVFIPEARLDQAEVARSVFHIVGPKEDHFRLLAPFDSPEFAPFFRELVKLVNRGTEYSFVTDAAARAKVERVVNDGGCFEEEATELARRFNEKHKARASVGAFLLLLLVWPDGGACFAMLKFDDDQVLLWELDETVNPPRPRLKASQHTFVKSKEALQKAVLVQLGRPEAELVVLDNQSSGGAANYFVDFLDARRAQSEATLTRKLGDLIVNHARKNPTHVDPSVLAGLRLRVYAATREARDLDAANRDEFLRGVLAPIPEGSPILADLHRKIASTRGLSEPFRIDGQDIKKPARKRMTTRRGVTISYPTDLPAGVVERTPEGVIIRDPVEEESDSDPEAARAR